MKKFLKTLSICLMLFFGAITLVACDNNPTNEDLNETVSEGVIYGQYYNNRDVYVVMGFQNEHKNILIKSEIKDKPVTIIGENAFKNSTSLESVTIPSSIEEIKKNAFNNCDNLISVTFDLGSRLKKISTGAFAKCDKLETFTIPGSVEVLESGLAENEGIFYKSKINTVNFEKNDNLTELGDYIFNNSQLKSIDLTLTKINKINSYSFKDVQLEEIKFNSTLKYIMDGAFASAGATKPYGPYLTITLPKSVQILGKEAFVNSYFLNINFEDESELKEISPNCFEGTRLESIIIPKSVTQIGHEAFYRSFVKTVSFEDESLINKISARAFFVCESLLNFEIPSSVRHIGTNAFYRTLFLLNNLSKAIKCKDDANKYVFLKADEGLQDISTIKNFEKVIVIADSAFADCGDLINVDMSNCSSLITIGNSAFATFSLEKIIIPNCVLNIGVKAIMDYYDLTVQIANKNTVDVWDLFKYNGEVVEDEYLEENFDSEKVGMITAGDTSKNFKLFLQDHRFKKQG